jgi:signal peptidase
MIKALLPTRASKSKYLLLFGCLALIYVFNNLPQSVLWGSGVSERLIKPVLWLGLGIMVWTFPAVRSHAPLKLKRNIVGWGFTFAVVSIMVSIIIGLIDGLGKSPYSHTITGMFMNMLVAGSKLIGMETVRSYLVNRMAKEERYLVFILVAAIMTLSNYSINKFTNLKELEDIVKYIAQYPVTDFCQNLFATFLAFLGGTLPALIYMGTLMSFHWLSPILPDFQWITASLVGILCPIVSLIVMQNIYLIETKAVNKVRKDKESPLSLILTSSFSVGIIWFAVGVFPIYPSVIATGSMEPMIKPGDMILVDKVNNEEDIGRLTVGDVIQFKREDILISHRIIEIVNNGNAECFRTKGDNNSVPDRLLVEPDQVKGKIVFVVPKIGWPTLLIRKSDNVSHDDLEF